MLLTLVAQSLSASHGLSTRNAAHRRPASWPARLLRSAAAGGEGAEVEPSGGDVAGTAAEELPTLKQVPYRAIAGLAVVGLADSAYLTAMKLLKLTPTCPLTGSGGAGGCSDILTSEYSNLFGVVPLAAVGMLAYGGMAALALAGARHSKAVASSSGVAATTAAAAAAGEHAAADKVAAAAAEPSAAQLEAEAPFRTGVLAGGLAMASCSAFLLYIMLTKFYGELCPLCLGSAALSFSIAVLAASGLRARELGEAAAPGAGVVATTLLLLSVGLGNPNFSFASGGYDLEYSLPAVTTPSIPGAVSLAQRLRDGGARMYGAFWCTHCYDQKQAFGAEAMDAFPYVECYPEGLHRDAKMAAVCEAAPGGLQGFPTWVIGGEQLVGEQTFEQLEAALAKVEAATVAPAPAS